MNRAQRRRTKKVEVTLSPAEMKAAVFHFVPQPRSEHVFSMQCICQPICEFTPEGATIIKHNPVRPPQS